MSSFLNKFTGSSNEAGNNTQGNSNSANQEQSGGGFMDKVNNMAGGGAKGEQNEDMLDKGKLSPTDHPVIFASRLLTRGFLFL